MIFIEIGVIIHHQNDGKFYPNMRVSFPYQDDILLIRMKVLRIKMIFHVSFTYRDDLYANRDDNSPLKMLENFIQIWQPHDALVISKFRPIYVHVSCFFLGKLPSYILRNANKAEI